MKDLFSWIILTEGNKIIEKRKCYTTQFLKIRTFLALGTSNGFFPIPGFQHGEGDGTPLWYSCLENPMDRGAWQAVVHGIEKSQTRLSDFTFTFHFLALEKEMATHSSVLAWRIPGTGEPGGLPSMRSHRIGHDWSNLAADSNKWTPSRWPNPSLPCVVQLLTNKSFRCSRG